MSLDIYGEYNDVNIKQNPNKKYTVEYSEIDGFIRSFTIDELEYEYSGVMPTDETFGIPFETSEEWNSDIQKDIPQSPSEVSGKVVKGLVNRISFMNLFLTENNPTWGLTINGKMSEEDLDNIASSIKNDANYKVEYTMDNGYIRHLTVEEITASVPTPVPSETEQTPTTSEPTENPTESQTDTQNQETNKQHILDDEPNTGLVF